MGLTPGYLPVAVDAAGKHDGEFKLVFAPRRPRGQLLNACKRQVDSPARRVWYSSSVVYCRGDEVRLINTLQSHPPPSWTPPVSLAVLA